MPWPWTIIIALNIDTDASFDAGALTHTIYGNLTNDGELYSSGSIGNLIMVETFNDRHSANGAWQYSIPTDASKKTIGWDQFLGDAPKRDFDPVRFFRWRNYQDYGTGVAGDLFVHLFSGLHVTLDS